MSAEHPLDRLRPGMRAVVRYRGAAGMNDALGQVERLDLHGVALRTRTGRRVVRREDVLLAKEVPPPPSRRGAQHRAISEDDLERVMVDGWPPLERDRLGEWVLRASGGFTRRANSLLPLGDPGVPLAEAVERAERWYADRGLPLVVASYVGDELPQHLAARGYRTATRSLVMTASTGTVVAATHHRADRLLRRGGPDAVDVSVAVEPSADWLAVAESTRATDPAALRRIVTGSPEQLFAEVRGAGGDVLAIGRAPLAHVWAGLTNVHVEPPARRRGVASLLTGALAHAVRARDVRSIWLQVEEDNAPARAAWEELGFTVHHRYRYLIGPRADER
ncbi:MAG TPA: GNAT family N-acetyltransferase [Segeticoccus sp.]|nr:GNAT family N-acetyltransferase [Segeticoccus sp.]